MSFKKHIPNAITCGNLICGCLAIICAFNGNLLWSGYFVLIASVLDFLDGFVARLLKVTSAIGKELDSLADIVTFGVVPGLVMYQLIQDPLSGFGFNSGWPSLIMPKASFNAVAVVALLIPVFSAIRLAKFNVDTRQSESFIGLPTPANAILICSLPFVFVQAGNKYLPEIMANYDPFTGTVDFMEEFYFFINCITYALVGLTILLSYMLVSNIHLFALKFKNYSWSDNKVQYIFLTISLILLIVFQLAAFPFVIVLYMIISIIHNIIRRKTPNA